MNHRVAIGAKRYQILDWIYLISLTYLCEWPQMMNVNKSTAQLSITTFEVKTANGA